MIQVQNLKKSYGADSAAVQALQGVNLTVQPEEFVAIVGPSGSGKTTLLNVVGGLDQAYAGQVSVAGQHLQSLSDRALSRFRNETIGFVFQGFHLLPHLSCGENVSLPTFFAAHKPPVDRVLRIAEVLRQVELDPAAVGRDITHARASQLSGGQKQRLAVARALYNRPKLLLCDEPTGNLDSVTGNRILDIFQSLNEQEGMTIIIITHEPHISARARRTLTMCDGQIQEDRS